jgi:hypothetical protein
MLTRITSDLSVSAARRLLAAMLGQSLASETPRHRSYEHSSDVASLASRENVLRRAGAQVARSATPSGRSAQRRP